MSNPDEQYEDQESSQLSMDEDDIQDALDPSQGQDTGDVDSD